MTTFNEGRNASVRTQALLLSWTASDTSVMAGVSVNLCPVQFETEQVGRYEGISQLRPNGLSNETDST